MNTKIDILHSDKIEVLREYSQMRCQNEAPFPILEYGLEMVQNKHTALNIGSGTMSDVERLISAGFSTITAIDPLNCHGSIEADQSRVRFEQCRVEEYEFAPQNFDFVSALFVFPFIESEKLSSVILKIVDSLKMDGIFVTTFFGKNDIRATDDRVITLDEDEIEALLEQLDILRVHEFEGMGNVLGKKQCVHIYRYITRKS